MFSKAWAQQLGLVVETGLTKVLKKHVGRSWRQAIYTEATLGAEQSDPKTGK